MGDPQLGTTWTPTVLGRVAGAAFDVAWVGEVPLASWLVVGEGLAGYYVWAWVGRNPGGFRRTLAIASLDVSGLAIDGAWGPGDTGASYIECRDPGGEVVWTSGVLSLTCP